RTPIIVIQPEPVEAETLETSTSTTYEMPTSQKPETFKEPIEGKPAVKVEKSTSPKSGLKERK
ncbi:MAG: hypothetical protein QXR45_10715, partial [Candidatus Bathyarchaeia archaeon]